MSRAWRRVGAAIVLVIAAAPVVHVAAQGRDPSQAPLVARTTVVVPPPADVPVEPPDDEDDARPPEPGTEAPPPRPLVVGGDVPDVPARTPDAFAVAAFENRSGVRALDWTVAAVPLSLAEKLEHELPLRPAYDAWVVPEGLPPAATPDAIAAFGAARGARWVWTGWVERPNWQLRLAVSLWRVDPGAAGGPPRAVRIGEVDQTAGMDEVHRLLGEAAARLATDAGFTLTDGQRAALTARAARDLYAFQLLGRGLGHLRGSFGAANLERARHDLERSVFIEPTMPVAQRLVGELWRAHPAPGTEARAASRAAGKFSYALDLDPEYLPAMRAAADAARAAGKREISRDLYDQLVRARPWDLDARVRLGEALWRTGRPDEAVRELDRAVRRAPENLEARRLLALVHADRGDLERLAVALEELARRAPDDVEVQLDLGATYVALARWDRARATYAALAAARPGDASVLKLAGDVELRRGDPAAAAGWYARMAKAAPDDPRPPFLLGQAWLAAGDHDQAYRALVRAQQSPGHLGWAYAALGAVRLRAGKRDEALWYLKRAARLRPHSAAARVALARVLLGAGLTAEGLAQVDAARTLGGEGAELDYLAAIGHAQAGDLAAGRDAIRAALAAAPGMAEARRAQLALDRGEVPAIEGAPALELPYGDVGALKDAIDRFLALDRGMAGLREAFDREALAVLDALGEGPGKDRSKEARRRPLPRTCPLTAVAKPWAAARALEAEIHRRGVALEDVYRRIVLADELGEGAGLTPDYERKVGEVRRAWRRALTGVREVRATLGPQLGRELAARRCKDDLLAAAAARPDLYGGTTTPPARTAPAATPVPRRATATIYVDNRECRDDQEVWIDGERVGVAPGGRRSAFEATVGQRAVCLLVPGESGKCGDRGTVRQTYLHDGWTALLRCRGERALAVEAMPTAPEGGAAEAVTPAP